MNTDTMYNSNRKYVVFILSAGILWGCLGVFVRNLNKAGIESMDIVFLRAFVTACCMLLYLLIFHRRLLKIRIKDIWCFIGTGVASIAFFNFCYFKAVIETSLSVAAVLLYTAPVFVTVLSFVLFKEKLTKKKLVSIVMTFAGCVLVTGVLNDNGTITVQGILYGLGAGLGYALYSIFGRYAINRGYHSFTITCYTFIVAAISTAFLADTGKIWNAATGSPVLTLQSVGLGVICTVAPFLLYTLGLTHVDNSKASVISSVEPVTATVLGCFMYSERINVSQAAGIILVIAGMAVANMQPFRDRQNVTNQM